MASATDLIIECLWTKIESSINSDSELITYISTCSQVGTYSVRTSRYLPSAKTSTYLVTAKLGQTQQYTLLIAITLAMSSSP